MLAISTLSRFALPCSGVRYSVVCPPLWVALPTASSSSGRLVMASVLAFGLAARQYQLHQLQTSAQECRGLAAVDVLRGEAASLTNPAVGTVAVELADGLHGVRRVGDQHRVLPQPLTFVHAGACQVQLELLAVYAPLSRDAAFDALAHDDQAALLAPTVKLQFIFNHLAALVVRTAPVLPRELLAYQALHVGGLVQAQQVGLAPALQLQLQLQLQQDAFVAGAEVTPDQGWTPALGAIAQLIEQPAQRIQAVLAGSSMRSNARRSASSLTSLFMPSACAATASPRSAVMWA